MTGKVQPTESGAETGGSLITVTKLQELYATMLHCRLLSEHARRRRHSGGLAGMSLGQEALTTGWMLDLRAKDITEPASPYGIGNLIRGIPVTEVLGQLSGNRKAGMADPGDQLSASLAAAAAHKRKKKGNVVVVFADAETCALSAWRKALKRAAKRRLPIIFVVENNAWVATAGGEALEDSVARTARRYGLPAITVDGNDVVAVYRVACESLQRVRHGDGPVVVEGKTYCVTGKRSSRANRDPLIRMERYLRGKKLFTAKWRNQLTREFSRDLATAGKPAGKTEK